VGHGMLNRLKRQLRTFGKDDIGGMTVEFVILFPILMMTFVLFMGWAFATMRSAMILDHAQQTARAYAIGYFVDEKAVEDHLDSYLWNVSAAKEVSTTDLPAPTAKVVDEHGYVTITITIPMLRLISIVGYASVFEKMVSSTKTVQVRAVIEGRP